MTTPGGAPGCGSHASLGAELRAVVVLALDRLGPALDHVRADGPGAPSSCATCPFCALMALLRGERPELAVRLAEHATGLLAVLQAALDGAATDEPEVPPAAPARRVQHIPVERPVPAA